MRTMAVEDSQNYEPGRYRAVCARDQGRRSERIIPAMGGKKTARKARQMSPQDMMTGLSGSRNVESGLV